MFTQFPCKKLVFCYKISLNSVNLCTLTNLTLIWQLIVFPKYKFVIPDLFEGPPYLFASFPIIILIGAGWLQKEKRRQRKRNGIKILASPCD